MSALQMWRSHPRCLCACRLPTSSHNPTPHPPPPRDTLQTSSTANPTATPQEISRPAPPLPPLPPAVSYMALRHQSLSRASAGQVAAAAASAVAAWACLFAAKLVLGYLLKQASASYVRHYEQKRGALKGRGGDRRVTMAGLGSFPGPGGSGSAAAAAAAAVTAATASAPGKKEE